MSYSLAVLDPFNPKAEGARVPDSYAFPTEAITFRCKYNVSCTDTFNQNWFDQVFKASPIDFLTQPAATGGSAQSAFTGNAINASASNVTPSPSPAGYEANWNQLKTYGWLPSSATGIENNNKGEGSYNWSKYRVVGGGIRMRSQLIPDKATGYLNFYSTETTRVDYSTPLFVGTDFTAPGNRAKLALHTGRPYVKTDTPSGTAGDIQQYGIVLNETMSEEPTGEVLDALSFNSKGCQMSFRPMTAQAYEWRNMTSAPKYNTGVSTNTSQEGTASSLIAGVAVDFDEAFYKCDGWNTFCVKGSQLPPALGGTGGSSELPIMVVEVILHVEFISADIGTTSFAKPMAHKQGLLDAVAARAAHTPLYRTLYAGSTSTANRKIRQRNGY